MTKQQLREETRRLFRLTAPEERRLWSQRICHDIMSDERILKASHILAFHPLKDEVDILPLLGSLLDMGKKVLLPEVVSDEDMVLKEYTGEDNLQKGVLGIMTPGSGVFTDYGKIDAALIPGIAFTPEGKRLGRGKGYYDRFLPLLNDTYKIGVCFPYQVVEDIPCEEFDIRVDHVQS